ncbi:hypothetical protein RUM44_003249 [Polyplax serrata]|uniref:Uncharacterized protein n=1 Tax=Polyplax serrata TaxID=468196 RepID=A0ABR1AFX7_POLSC
MPGLNPYAMTRPSAGVNQRAMPGLNPYAMTRANPRDNQQGHSKCTSNVIASDTCQEQVSNQRAMPGLNPYARAMTRPSPGVNQRAMPGLNPYAMTRARPRANPRDNQQGHVLVQVYIQPH